MGNQEGLNTSIRFAPSDFEKMQMEILNFCSIKKHQGVHFISVLTCVIKIKIPAQRSYLMFI